MVEHRDGDIEQIADPDQPESMDQSMEQPNAGDSESIQPQEQLDQLPETPTGQPALPLLDELSDAIARYPDAPANYVLRGEYFLAEGRNDLAAEDFRTALRL